MTNPAQITITSPQLIDAAFADIQTKLQTGLSWLTKAYGKAQRLTRIQEKQKIYYPAVPSAGVLNKEYLGMFPDGHLGNYCFFDVEDGQDFRAFDRKGNQFSANFGLIFWYDLRSIYPFDYATRTNENVKQLVLDVLKSIAVQNISLRFTAFYDRADNIYKGYTISEIDNQFLMRPFGGFRIEGEIMYREVCA